MCFVPYLSRLYSSFILRDKLLLPKVPGNANQLHDSTTSCWETWLLDFCKMGRRCTGISLSIHFSTSTCQTDGLATLDKMTRCSASGPRDHQTVCDFFLWRYVKDRVYAAPLPATVYKLQEHITAAVKSVMPDKLQNVWSKLDYHIDVCQVRRGSTLSVWYHMKLWVYVTVATNFVRIFQ